jgi:hypothetical protein
MMGSKRVARPTSNLSCMFLPIPFFLSQIQLSKNMPDKLQQGSKDVAGPVGSSNTFLSQTAEL